MHMGWQYLLVLSRLLLFLLDAAFLLLCTMAWSNADRARALRLYFREGSVVAAQRAFRRELGRRVAPERHTFLRWVADFEESGRPARPKQNTPRPRVSRAAVRAVMKRIRRNPLLSIRRLSLQAQNMCPAQRFGKFYGSN